MLSESGGRNLAAKFHNKGQIISSSSVFSCFMFPLQRHTSGLLSTSCVCLCLFFSNSMLTQAQVQKFTHILLYRNQSAAVFKVFYCFLEQEKSNLFSKFDFKILFFFKVTCTELERLKNSYRQVLKDAAQAKKKYQDTSKGGISTHSLLNQFQAEAPWCLLLLLFLIFLFFVCVQTRTETKTESVTSRLW